MFTFDALFNPQIAIEKKTGRRFEKEGVLVDVLDYGQPEERVLAINLPKEVMVFDVKHMIRVVDHSSNFYSSFLLHPVKEWHQDIWKGNRFPIR